MNTEIKPISNLEIHSIAIGIVGSGLQYTIGKIININDTPHTITSIVRDENSYEYFKEVVYMIFATSEKEKEEKCIKYFIDQPVYVSVKL